MPLPQPNVKASYNKLATLITETPAPQARYLCQAEALPSTSAICTTFSIASGHNFINSSLRADQKVSASMDILQSFPKRCYYYTTGHSKAFHPLFLFPREASLTEKEDVFFLILFLTCLLAF